MADHNDPNAVNSIFSDIDVSAADLYDIFGFPSDDLDGGEKVVIALTFASVPEAGVIDSDMLYRIQIAPDRRVMRPAKEDHSLEGLLKYFEGLKDKYLGTLKPSEIRVTVDQTNRATVRFLNFRDGDFAKTIDTNEGLRIRPRQFADLGAQDLHDRRRGVPAREEGLVPGDADAGQFLEQERLEYSAAAPGRDFHSQRQLDRHGHDRHLAVRTATGRPGGHPVSLAVSRYGRRMERQEVPRRAAQRPSLVGRRADRAQDAAQSTQERQGFSRSLPVPGGAVVAETCALPARSGLVAASSP